MDVDYWNLGRFVGTTIELLLILLLLYSEEEEEVEDIEEEVVEDWLLECLLFGGDRLSEVDFNTSGGGIVIGKDSGVGGGWRNSGVGGGGRNSGVGGGRNSGVGGGKPLQNKVKKHNKIREIMSWKYCKRKKTEKKRIFTSYLVFVKIDLSYKLVKEEVEIQVLGEVE